MFDAAFRDSHKISPSQIETSDICDRKWALEKLDGIKRPPNKYAQRGDDAHKVLEDWQNGSTIDFDSDIGKIVAPGLRFLPKPGSHLTEHWFIFRTENATYHGKKDLKGKDPSPIRTVWDHKTTVDLKWMKTPEKLRRDPQANIYAVSEIREAEELGIRVERVEQNWVYYQADPEKPKARKVQLHVLPDQNTRVPVCPKDVQKDHFGIMYYDELFERFAEIEQKALKLLEYHRRFEAGEIRGGIDVPYDVGGCDKFGGCPYRDVSCVLTVRERIAGMEAKMKLGEKMKADLAAKQAAAGGAAPANGSSTSAKPSPGAAAAAAAIKSGAAEAATKPLPETNPPEHSRGVDPDAPRSAAVLADAGDRMGVVVEMAAAIVSSRIYALGEDKEAPAKIASLAVKVGDAVIVELAKKK